MLFVNGTKSGDSLSLQDIDEIKALYKVLSPKREFDLEQFLASNVLPFKELYITRLGSTSQSRKILGMAQFGWMPWGLTTKGYIEDVAVLPEYEGQGYGTSLVRDIIQRARELGVDSLWLTSHENRSRAHMVYRKLGFEQAETTLFVKNLS